MSRAWIEVLRVLTQVGTPAEAVIYTAELARSAIEEETRRQAEQQARKERSRA